MNDSDMIPDTFNDERDPSVRTHADIEQDFDDIDDGFDFERECTEREYLEEAWHLKHDSLVAGDGKDDYDCD